MPPADVITFMGIGYDWQAALAALAVVVVVTAIFHQLIFRLDAVKRTRQLNRQLDAEKMAQAKYPPAVARSNYAGLAANLVLLVLVVPFAATTQLGNIGYAIAAVPVILLVHDFFYYLTHRFLFHGNGYFRRVHGLHHQARLPSHVDSYYVHPLETVLGVAIFFLAVLLASLMLGRLHFTSIALAHVIFTQISILNHVKVDLPYFPFRFAHWISAKHAIHHENMQKGNYAGITPLYDRLFGTYE